MKNVPNADCFSVAPYILHELTQEDLITWEVNEDLFRWAFAWPLDRSLTPERSMTLNGENARKAGIELSIYEVNHHITRGDAPAEPRNRVVTSISGGINVCNSMLLMLQEQGIRNQCLFGLVQKGYRTSVGEVRLWGTALNMRNGHERYRPTFLACEMANRVMGGNLLQTTQNEGAPTFTATGRLEDKKPGAVVTFPTIWSYAFQNKNQRGLILINLDTNEPQAVQLKFEGAVQASGAMQYTLVGDSLDANNEFEVSEPQVTVEEKNLPEFTSGTLLNLPPHSMVVLEWEQSD